VKGSFSDNESGSGGGNDCGAGGDVGSGGGSMWYYVVLYGVMCVM
jgi:hypothetical protein